MSNSVLLERHRVPAPIIVATGRTAGDGGGTYLPDATVYEMTPWEFGSWDPENAGAFVPIRNLGTSLYAGRTTDSTCLTELDNAS
jgi:lysophospholipase